MERKEKCDINEIPHCGFERKETTERMTRERQGDQMSAN